jgi:hypothetical protein
VLSPSTFSLAQRSLPSVVPLCLAFPLQHVERNIHLVSRRCRLFTVHLELNWSVRSDSLIGVSQLPLLILVFLHSAFAAFNLNSTFPTCIFLSKGVV